MKERPILMSGPMVRAILADAKTQTRRVVRDADHFSCLTGDCPHWHQNLCDAELALHCPYGKLGDRLWVRETFSIADSGDVIYADGALNRPPTGEPLRYKRRPSIHMPRSACRLVLDVLGSRVERLQAITEADAKAEGMHEFKLPTGSVWGYNAKGTPGPHLGGSAREAYAHLWEELNFKRGHGWKKNPWVWVVEFKRAQ